VISSPPMSKLRVPVFLLGFLFGLSLLATCNVTPVASGSLDMLVRVADAIGIDVRDARADAPMSSDCNKTYSQTSTQNGVTTKATWNYAEFLVPGFDPRQPPHLTTFICDFISPIKGPVAAWSVYAPCQPNTVCDSVPAADCIEASSAPSTAGVVRVMCGVTYAINNTPQDNLRATRAYLKVGP